MTVNRKSSFRPSIETLEGRTLMAASITPTFYNGVLTITGTERADSIYVDQSPRTGLTYVGTRLDGEDLGRYRGVTKVVVYGLGGNDYIHLNHTGAEVTVKTILSGGAGDDAIIGGSGDDWIDGGTGNDRLYGMNGADLMGGQEGQDTMLGGSGNDVLYGGSGNDLLIGEQGNDNLEGMDGNDELQGDSASLANASCGQDLLDGGNGNDRLFGQGNSDILGGGAGDDWIIGGSGADVAFGGDGSDQFWEVANDRGFFLTPLRTRFGTAYCAGVQDFHCDIGLICIGPAEYDQNHS